MAFLHPRLVRITRPNPQVGVGVQSYGGHTENTETEVARDIRATIQQKKRGRHTDAALPADGAQGDWNIYFRLPGDLQQLTDAVQNRDIITDDQEYRYQVVGAYWNPLGWKCFCERLET